MFEYSKIVNLNGYNIHYKKILGRTYADVKTTRKIRIKIMKMAIPTT